MPERVVRSLTTLINNLMHESAQLLLPRLVRRSRLYEASAKNLLRVTIELVGGVEGASTAEPGGGVGQLAVRKGAGNIVELGSIAAFGFSPLWLLAAASDLARGSRVYLDALVAELKVAGVLAPEAEFGSVDELLGALEHGSGTAARLVDMPPLEVAELRSSMAELRANVDDLPSPDELALAYEGLRRAARAEGRSLLEVSTGIGLAFLLSARSLSREHLVVPYREDWSPLRDEGFAAYAGRVAQPYGQAVEGHFDPKRSTWTEQGLERLTRSRRRDPS